MITLLLACASPEIGLIRGDDPLWDPWALPVLRVEFPEGGWPDRLWENIDIEDDCSDRPYVAVNLRFENPATGESEDYPDVGMRLRGHASLRAAAEGTELPGYKFSFNAYVDGRTLHGAKRIGLLGTEGDFTWMREQLALAVARDVGIPAPRSSYALLYVNGTFEGIHAFTEETDDAAYVYNHFPGRDGYLFEANGYCGGEPPMLAYLGDDPEVYTDVYEPVAGTPTSAITQALVPMLQCASEATDEAFVACIGDWIDIDAFLALIALDHVTPDADGMVGRAHNYMLFFDGSTRTFTVYPWDKDQSFYTWEVAAQSTPFDLVFATDNEYKPLLVDRLQRLYPERYCVQLRAVLDRIEPDHFGPEIERRAQFLWDPLSIDPRVDFPDWKYGVQAMIDETADWQVHVAAQVDAACP